ncbi:hypothetical protein [Spirochaeta isovalerica]|uniref:Uncharacterized protein n=1 Tax=Spirochaeta isovalerica TaxID=150 RepID=A0A841RET6_9SPIO|nr:hypothetical protein [Spirochaeta isovalerica]MBB6480862.1 hypothetical protein [Spirochaeta isovalerica]
MDIKKYKRMYDEIWPYAQTFKLDLKQECLNKGIPETLIDKFMKADSQIDFLTEIDDKFRR